MRIPFLVFLFLPVLGLHAEPVRVGVSILPLESVVRDIAGEHVEVQSLAREGDSCSVFEPRPSVINWMAKARLFFRTGVGYETVILDKLASRFPEMRIVDLRDAVDVLKTSGHIHADPAHCPSCAGSAEMTDPHIWLDPVRLSLMARLIADELGRLMPEHADFFAESAAAFTNRAAGLDQDMDTLLEPHSGKAFYIYHPALGYFADRYNLEQVGIAGATQGPSARELHNHVKAARESGVSVVFVQPQESRRQAGILAGSIDAELVEIDPMGRDWEATIRHIGEAVAASFVQ